MKILLTGAAGYIGSELVPTLSERGHDLWGVVRFADQCVPGLEADRLIVHDLTQPLALNRTDFDLVLHAAGANDVASCDPASALSLTALTTRRAAEFTLQQAAPRLLYLSTFQVYGTNEGAVDEMTPCRPTNDYALTHLFAEQWVEQYARTTPLQHVIVRPANIAGIPRGGQMARWTLTPGCFCLEAFRDRRIVVRSTGQQQRDFLPLAEVAREVAAIAEDFATYVGGPVNVCAGVSLTIAEVARIAAEQYRLHFGTDCALEFQPQPGTPLVTPSSLLVSGRWLNNHPADRFTSTRAREAMIQCIDQTYRYLKRSA